MHPLLSVNCVPVTEAVVLMGDRYVGLYTFETNAAD
jgi:hypothetical protein